MDLALIISLAPQADEFVRAFIEQSQAWPRSKLPDAYYLPITSCDWYRQSADIPQCLAGLGDQVLAFLKNRGVARADICFVIPGNDAQAVLLFPSICDFFERFLRVVTTRRLFAIYPREARLLKEFAENWSKIQECATSTKHEFSAMSFLLAPSPSSAMPWPLDQVRAKIMCHLMPGCRAKVDQLLTNLRPRTVNSSYGSCLYDEQEWRGFATLRCLLDLTARKPVSGDAALRIQAETVIEKTGLLLDESRIRYAEEELGEMRTSESLALISADGAVQAHVADSHRRQRALCQQIANSEAPRLHELAQTYRRELIDVLDQDCGSLNSLEQALGLHQTLLGLLVSPAQHQEFFRKIVEPSLKSMVDDLLDFASQFSEGIPASHAVLDELTPRAKVEILSERLAEVRWSEISMSTRAVLLHIVAFARATAEIAACIVQGETPRDAEISAAIAKSFAALLSDHLLDNSVEADINATSENLDRTLVQLQAQHAAGQRALERVNALYGFFKRLWCYREYQSASSAILAELQDLEQRYQQWRLVASVFCSVTGRFRFLQHHVALTRELAEKRRRQVEATGQFLVDFARDLDARHHQVGDALAAIPEKPEIRNEVELPFLARPEMEAMYQKFGPARIGEYIRCLLRDTKDSWGLWAVKGLRRYLEGLAEYCGGHLESFPELTLPKLMFEHFPQLRVARIRQVIEFTRRRLLPLTDDDAHKRDRTFQILLGFPQLHWDQLAADESQYATDEGGVSLDQRISLKPTQVARVDNDDPAALDVTISLCGFLLEDYQYWGVFDTSQE